MVKRTRSADRLPIFGHKRSGSHRRQYVNDADVRVVLSRLPKHLWSRLEKVVFRDGWGRRRCLGYTLTNSRRDIVLCDLPAHLSLGQLCARSGIQAEEFGAPAVGQWPPLALRRFQLYDTLLHEIGHLQIVHPKDKSPRRKFADEPLAEAFASEWRAKLWAEPFDHPDPVHHPPDCEEIELVRSNWARAHAIYRSALNADNEARGTGVKRFEATRSEYEKAVALFPQHSLALARLGQARFCEGGRYEAALDCFLRVRTIDPCLPEAWLYGGMCCGRLGREADTRRWFEGAIELDRAAPISRAVFAEELARLGQLEEAERLFRAILRSKPRELYPLRAYARFLFYKFDESRDAEAIIQFRKVLELEPDDYGVLCELGDALHAVGSLTEALEVLTKAIRLFPERERAKFL